MLKISKLHDIRLECTQFLQFIEDGTNLQKSTQAFWNEYGFKFPSRCKVARKIFSIPASSAFVERFFSVCGLACHKRSMNMKSETLIEKVMMRVNIDLINCKQQS